jgi:hypothetical protein
MPEEPIPIDVTFRSDILSDHCKFEVTLHVTGTRTPHGHGVETHINTFSATGPSGKTFRWTQAGTTVQKVEPDGTTFEQLTGHNPVHFDGVQRINPNTDEIIFTSSKESNHERDLDKICQALTGPG